MSSSMLVHDTRLSGTAPTIAPNTYRVNGSTSLKDALSWIATYARKSGGLDQLSIMCHGYEGGVHDGRVGVSTMDLGFGLQFCREGLTLGNVDLAGRLDGLVEIIILYACGPANTRAGFEGTSADGREFCRELAGWTGAEVLAAIETQYYLKEPRSGLIKRLFRIGADDTINFGNWEGQLYRFSPDGTVMPTAGRW
jgi:hypothetical protein